MLIVILNIRFIIITAFSYESVYRLHTRINETKVNNFYFNKIEENTNLTG